MILKVLNVIVVEGEPVELAMYTHTWLEIFKMKAEFDEQKKAESELSQILDRFGSISFEDLLNGELNDNSKHDDNENVTGGETQ